MFPWFYNKINNGKLRNEKEKRILQLHIFFQRLFYQNYLDIFTKCKTRKPEIRHLDHFDSFGTERRQYVDKILPKTYVKKNHNHIEQAIRMLT